MCSKRLTSLNRLSQTAYDRQRMIMGRGAVNNVLQARLGSGTSILLFAIVFAC